MLVHVVQKVNVLWTPIYYLLTYILTYLLIYLLTYLIHGAESSLRS